MDTELVLPGTLPGVHAVIRELWTALQALGAEYERMLVEHRQLLVEQAALRERVADLERRLGQNSSNSSRPPSSDPHGRPAGVSAPSSPAKRQPGRQASQRELLPPDQVDQVVVVWPERCQHCGRTLPECPDLVAALPERHQHPQADFQGLVDRGRRPLPGLARPLAGTAPLPSVVTAPTSSGANKASAPKPKRAIGSSLVCYPW